jgi:hypothetical protein
MFLSSSRTHISCASIQFVRRPGESFIFVNNYSILFRLSFFFPSDFSCNSVGCVRASLRGVSGAAAAAKIYLESLSRVAKQAQQGTCGGTADIGKTKNPNYI